MNFRVLAPLLFTSFLAIAVADQVSSQAQLPRSPVDLKETFFSICDMACAHLAEDSLFQVQPRRQYYKDSYSIRALAAAYDMTGNDKYLKACQAWSDIQVRVQDEMIPKGAYYMNYGRKPGESKGEWFVADSSSIAMGVLATAIRTENPALHAKYLRSVEQFVDLVISNYTKDRGIANGCWSKFDGPTWCTTGIFGSLAFLLYNESADPRYLEVGLAAVDWLNSQDLEYKGEPSDYKVKDWIVPDMPSQGAVLMMYFCETYSAGLPYIQMNTRRRAGMMAHIERFLQWMNDHSHNATGAKDFDYNTPLVAKIGGIPFHMYVWSNLYPKPFLLRSKADDELEYLSSIIFDKKRFKKDRNNLSELMNFTMLSLAEKLSPGSIYRR